MERPPKYTVEMFKAFAKAYMEDCNDLCNVTYFAAKLNPQQTSFNLSVRRYRHGHSWLRQNLTERDRFARLSDDGKTIFYGLRTHPQPQKNHTSKQVAIIAHMGGTLAQINLGDLLKLDLTQWQVAIATPGLELGNQLSKLKDLELRDGQGLLLESR